MTPFAKTGGLADVAGALPLALGKLGVEVMILMPRYRGLKSGRQRLSENVSVGFVDHEAYFNRASLYGDGRGDYLDNLERFSFFSHAIFEDAKRYGFKPDVIHCNDWQASLVPVLLKTRFYQDSFFKKTRTLLTVHNMAYQGVFSHKAFEALGLGPGLYSAEGVEFHGKANLLKAGLIFADDINTVSPAYASEIQTKEYGCGLEGVVGRRADRLKGILNGIDTEEFNPKKDKVLKKKFSADEVSGKAACKAELQRLSGLEENAGVPVFSLVSRLAEQKGLDLVSEIADAFLSKRVQFVLLGEGDAVYHTTFRNIGVRHPKKAAIRLSFDAQYAHRIYAGADFFLMPSFFEPCGLGQMISMRYGTVPVVRRTGGLADTVFDADADPKKGNGFVFEGHGAERLLAAIERASGVFLDKTRLAAIRQNGMKQDFSWQKSAMEYRELYKEMMRR